MGLTLADIFFTLLQTGVGKSLDDLKYNYTIDQIYLLYEKSRKYEIDSWRMQTVILVESLVATHPKGDKNDARQANIRFKKFMDSLDWDKIINKKDKMSKKEVKGAFSRAFIPIKKV